MLVAEPHALSRQGIGPVQPRRLNSIAISSAIKNSLTTLKLISSVFINLVQINYLVIKKMSKNYEWHVKADMSKIEGKSFAIVDQKPVASGTDAKNVYEEAKAKLPTQTHWFWADMIVFKYWKERKTADGIEVNEDEIKELKGV